MKKILISGVILIAALLITADLFAFSGRRGPTWIKNPSRAATINHIDAAQYNPAGLTSLEEGMYLYLGNQMGFKTIDITIGSVFTDTDDKPALLVPNLTLAYVGESGAVFFTFDVVGGGGTINYENQIGVAWLETMALRAMAPIPDAQIVKAEGNDATLGFTFGAAYEINEMISVAGGVRLLMNQGYLIADGQSTIVGFTNAPLLNNDYTNYGFTGFIGLNITPIEMINLAIVFQPTTYLKGTGTNNLGFSGNFQKAYTYATETFENGFFTIGLGIRPIEDLEVQLSFKYNFTSPRRYGSKTALVATDPLGMYNTTAENYGRRAEMDLAIGFEYSLGLIRPSFGLNYNRTGGTHTSNYLAGDIAAGADPDGDSITVAVGCSIVPMDMITIDVGVAKVFYADMGGYVPAAAGGATTLSVDRDAWLIGIGVGATF